MGAQPAVIPIDPAVEAGELADTFNDLSQLIDEFRLADHQPPCTTEELSRLKDEAQAMEDRAHHFTAAAIGATLQSVQDDLGQIKWVTEKAKTQLNDLNKVSRVISVATSALSLGTAIAAGNPGSILAAAEALGQTLSSS